MNNNENMNNVTRVMTSNDILTFGDGICCIAVYLNAQIFILGQGTRTDSAYIRVNSSGLQRTEVLMPLLGFHKLL